MSVPQMREAIKEVYCTKSWKQKVAKMPAKQVCAVYLSFKQRGLL